MRGLLLDTHALLWMVRDDSRLSKKARREIERSERLAVSAVSFWEIALKLSGRGFDFPLPHNWHDELDRELRRIGSLRIELQPDHCRRLQDLAWHHKDPFDRLLIAQAEVEDLAILTSDRRFREYGVRALW